MGEMGRERAEKSGPTKEEKYNGKGQETRWGGRKNKTIWPSLLFSQFRGLYRHKATTMLQSPNESCKGCFALYHLRAPEQGKGRSILWALDLVMT